MRMKSLYANKRVEVISRIFVDVVLCVISEKQSFRKWMRLEDGKRKEDCGMRLSECESRIAYDDVTLQIRYW